MCTVIVLVAECQLAHSEFIRSRIPGSIIRCALCTSLEKLAPWCSAFLMFNLPSCSATRLSLKVYKIINELELTNCSSKFSTRGINPWQLAWMSVQTVARVTMISCHQPPQWHTSYLRCVCVHMCGASYYWRVHTYISVLRINCSCSRCVMMVPLVLVNLNISWDCGWTYANLTHARAVIHCTHVCTCVHTYTHIHTVW